MRIVVVEDEHNSREGLIRLIGRLDAGDEVVGEAMNGTDGMAVIEQMKPDLVITDINMPGMSGLEMLSQLRSKGFRHKMIILTGYSEFEYAQRALKMSVSDYLEKPITVPDLREALDNVRADLEEQKQQSQQHAQAAVEEEPGTLDSMFLRLMDLLGEEAEQQEARIRAKLGFRDDQPFHLSVVSYGSYKEKQLSTLRALLESEWKLVGTSTVFGLASRGILIGIAQAEDADFDAAKLVDERLIPAISKAGLEVQYSLGEVFRLSNLKRDMEELLELAKWSMVLGSKRAIRRENVNRVATREIPYPVLLEGKCSRAIVTANSKDIEKQFHSMVNEFKDMKYGPVLTIEYSIRFVSYMLKLAGDVHGFMLPEPLQSEWQRSLRDVRSLGQFEQTMNRIGEALLDIDAPAETPVYSLLIQKAVRIVQEQYAEGITLDEIADNLRVTMAYLSGQFNKEVGRPFSVYIRDLRLRKAKELLLGSELRTFEIAQQVGYPDPKYFSRVFKEATGMTPGEYQKLNAR
ncbi:YesN/AraC family two-component response regulator [Paenibacillus cellulosilyticus]|uniref:YesN/AraC family two-component response regulator n=1 Tax=Paenibacillus cellulosilyticus TaxID=375489 RepID=A0A2V2YZL5_9BACL|nr:response regulator [Paenibacillus cellulosilyticus]PWW07237.1 YesN/AraC family two-component response regulator [Paenibacillus cellulosilyticus]QKS44572.1 response regulator [Paenibacillus cellulosilyticus]